MNNLSIVFNQRIDQNYLTQLSGFQTSSKVAGCGVGPYHGPRACNAMTGLCVNKKLCVPVRIIVNKVVGGLYGVYEAHELEHHFGSECYNLHSLVAHEIGHRNLETWVL